MREKLRRAGWLFLAALFVFTGLGVGVYAFWQATHPQNNTNNTSQTANNSNSCQFSGALSGPVLPAPTAYIPTSPTDSLSTTDLTQGSGRAAKSGDCLTVKYYGTLASNGQKFDEDYTQPLALQFQLGQGVVIPGWDAGLVGMKVGGERRLVIAPSLAYGSQAQGSIPANSTLVFVVKLLSIK